MNSPLKAAEKTGDGAFTLIEVLICILIIAILAALSMGGVKRLQQSAKNTKALQNMRTLLAAQMLYAGDNNNSFTPVYGDAPDGLTWGVRLFPYLGLTGRTFEDVAKDPTSVLNVPESMPANQRVAYGRSIAMNGYVRNTSNPSWNYRVAAVNQPSKVLLLVEIMERNAEYISVDTSGSKNGLGFRWDNGRRCRVGFCDGHAEALTAEELSYDKNAGKIVPSGTGYPWSFK